jgi:hypothetical protein
MLPGVQNSLQQSQRHPLHYLKTKAERVEMALWFLAAGGDYAVMVRPSRAN